MVMSTEEKKHPLQMETKGERKARHSLIKSQMKAIEALLQARIADPHKPDVYPDLESEWAELDTERKQLEELGV